MPYWTYHGSPNNTPFLAAYAYGETFSFSMGLVNDTEASLENVCLFVDQEFVGLLSMRLPGEADYRPIMGIYDSAAYVGSVPVGELQIDFQYCNDRYPDLVFYVIPVIMGTDPLIRPPNTCWHIDYGHLWASCYAKHRLWRTDYREPYPECEPDVPVGTGFSASPEPQLFEDSPNPHLWDDGVLPTV